ncbi:MAG TPA: cytidine/deoxycytidylate deaminase family protein [bacterium]|nr:cytidine/deoxycytidylate deaminase family protein [bacterium]
MKRRRSQPRAAAARRPTWDEYFLTIAELVASRSSCGRRKVGAVLVRDQRILATGYNGAPRGVRHCSEAGCIREKFNVPSGERHELCRGLHAEQNALIQAAVYGTPLAEITVYCTTQPCVLCAKMLINAGVRRIVYRGSYPDALSLELLREAKVALEQHNLDGTVTTPTGRRRR